jgi:hypothetical protein
MSIEAPVPPKPPCIIILLSCTIVIVILTLPMRIYAAYDADPT